MSYNGRVWNTHPDGFQLDERTIDIEIPKEVMEELYIPIDGKVYISDNGNFTARMKLDNSLGGRELKLGLRVNGQDQQLIGGKMVEQFKEQLEMHQMMSFPI